MKPLLPGFYGCADSKSGFGLVIETDERRLKETTWDRNPGTVLLFPVPHSIQSNHRCPGPGRSEERTIRLWGKNDPGSIRQPARRSPVDSPRDGAWHGLSMGSDSEQPERRRLRCVWLPRFKATSIFQCLPPACHQPASRTSKTEARLSESMDLTILWLTFLVLCNRHCGAIRTRTVVQDSKAPRAHSTALYRTCKRRKSSNLPGGAEVLLSRIRFNWKV